MNVRFQDGTELVVQRHPINVEPSPLESDLPLAVQLPRLRRLANEGNAAAALALYRELMGCKAFLGSGEPGQESVHEDDQDVDRLEIESYCANLSADDIESARGWLDLAASRGDAEALKAQAMNAGMTEAGVSLWSAVWKLGHVSALEPLAGAALSGVGTSNGQPDPVTAYAYVLLKLRLLESASAGGSNKRLADRLETAQEALRIIDASLNPQQALAAERIASDILRANPNCCRSNW